MEPEFWAAFDEAVTTLGLSPTAYVTALDEARDRPLASAIRTEMLKRAQVR